MLKHMIRLGLVAVAVILLASIKPASVLAGDPPPPPPPPPGVVADSGEGVEGETTLALVDAGRKGPKKLPKSIRAANSPTGSAGANSAVTTDGSGYYKTNFAIGDAIRYYGGVYNSTGSYQWVHLWFYRTTPCGTTLLWQGWQYARTGTSYYYYPTTTYCSGVQTFTFWVYWNGVYTSRAINYTVGVTLLGPPQSDWTSTIVSSCRYDNKCAGAYPKNHHTGVDSWGSNTVVASGPGKIYKIFPNGQSDHGYGNTVIIEHKLTNGTLIWTLSIMTHSTRLAQSV